MNEYPYIFSCMGSCLVIAQAADWLDENMTGEWDFLSPATIDGSGFHPWQDFRKNFCENLNEHQKDFVVFYLGFNNESDAAVFKLIWFDSFCVAQGVKSTPEMLNLMLGI